MAHRRRVTRKRALYEGKTLIEIFFLNFIRRFRRIFFKKRHHYFDEDEYTPEIGSGDSTTIRIQEKPFLDYTSSEPRRKKRKRRNKIRSYFSRRLERLADRMEMRREMKNKRRFMRDMRRRQRKEQRTQFAFVKFFKKLFEAKSREYGYYSTEGIDKEKQELKRQQLRLAFFSINSFILFVLSYIIVYLTYQMAVMFAASRYGINSILLYYEVFFPIGNYSDKWTSLNIIIITFAGPLISAIMGSIYLLYYVRKETTAGLKKLFFLWLGFHSVNFFLGAFVGGMVTQQGFGYVIAWMFLPTVIKFAFAMLCLFGLGLLGYVFTQYFLEASGSFFWTNESNRIFYLLFAGVAPWVLGTLLLFIIKFPKVVPQHENIVIYDTIINMCLIFTMAGMFVNYKVAPNIERSTKREGRRINWIYLVILLGLMVIFRLGFNSGFYYLPN